MDASNLDLLSKIKDQDLIHTLSIGEKFQGALMVTLLGMGITFMSLILIRYLTSLLSYIVMKIESRHKANVEIVSTDTSKKAEEIEQIVDESDDEELIAVISAAIAASLNTSIHNIVVRNIVRTEDSTPTWGQVGRMEQLNSTINR